jgi:hypothetical protein
MQREEDREPGTIQPGGAEEPGQEGTGLVLLADAEEGVDADAGVARPGVAVVPVADAAEYFGQRGRGCGDGRTGRRVRQEAKSEQAADHGFPVRQQSVDAIAPCLPSVLVVLE